MNAILRAALGAALVVVVAPLSTGAAEKDAKGNAALAHWQAFAMVPQLDKRQLEIVGDHDKVKLGAEVDRVLASCETSLRLLHRAVRHRECDWGTNVDEDGMYTLLPHVDRGFRLVRIALLRARQRFENADPRGGLEDTLAAMALGRHLGVDRLPISFLVQQAIDRKSVDLLARHLPALGAAERAALAKRLDALPTGCTLKEALQMEKRPTSTWLLGRLQAVQKDAPAEWKTKVRELLAARDHFPKSDRGEKVQAMLDRLPKDGLAQLIRSTKEIARSHDAIIALADKGPAEAGKKLKALFDSEAVKKNPLSEFLMPGVNYVVFWERTAEGRARLAMLKAAIAVQGGKVDDLKSHPDPYGKGPFTHKAVVGGFELTSALKIKDKEVSLRIGAGK